MPHALTDFIQTEMRRRSLSRDRVIDDSGLSKQLVGKWINDKREKIDRLPARETLAGFAKALRVPMPFLVGKAIESLGLGYDSGDYISTVDDVSNDELLSAVRRRMREEVDDAGDPGGTLTPINPSQPDEPPASSGRPAARKAARTSPRKPRLGEE